MEDYIYKGFFKCSCVCGVEVFNHNGNTIVIMTELPKNKGTSVTNMVEGLASSIRENKNLSGNIIWIEHYPERGRIAESFDRVNMIDTGNEYLHAVWQRMTKEEVETLIGKTY